MLNIILVGLGGFVGAVCRYLLGLIPVSEAFIFPIKTLIINVLGCIAIGAIALFTTKHTGYNQGLILFLKVGICGGFTTFSTFALETTDLMRSGHGLMALLYVLLSVIAGVGTIYFIESLG